MIADISPRRKEEFSVSWDNGRFNDFYNAALDGYFALSCNLAKSKNPDEIRFIEYGLAKLKSAIIDMNTFKAAKTAAAAAH